MEQIITGIKLEMTQIFSDEGLIVPATKVKCEGELQTELVNRNVTVTGKSKGKGFAGVMKKWHFKGSMATRGQSDKPRAAGSIGGQTPGRVYKGKKMAGRMGNQTVTVSGLRIVGVDGTKNELMVSGALPGSRNSKIKIRVLEK